MRILLLINFTCFLTFLNAQKVYQSNGVLIADSSFKVSETIAREFNRFESSIIEELFSHLSYPKTKSEGDIIVSYTVDSMGALNHFTVEKGNDAYLKAAVLNVLVWWKNPVVLFAAKGKALNKMYLPVRFQKKHSTRKFVEGGWLIIQG